MATPKKFLRRYTDLPGLIHLLQTETNTFLDPASWDDKNDAYFMELYKQHKKLSTLLAICLSMDSETYHHWRVFSNGSSGVCISFHREHLIHSLRDPSSIRYGDVRYLKIKELRANPAAPDELPFLKR